MTVNEINSASQMRTGQESSAQLQRRNLESWKRRVLVQEGFIIARVIYPEARTRSSLTCPSETEQSIVNRGSWQFCDSDRVLGPSIVNWTKIPRKCRKTGQMQFQCLCRCDMDNEPMQVGYVQQVRKVLACPQYYRLSQTSYSQLQKISTITNTSLRPHCNDMLQKSS